MTIVKFPKAVKQVLHTLHNEVIYIGDILMVPFEANCLAQHLIYYTKQHQEFKVANTDLKTRYRDSTIKL